MKGLDCSEILNSDLDSDDATRRIDSEFFSKRYLLNAQTIRGCGLKTTKLCDLTTKIDVGHVGSMVHAYSENGVPLLLTQNIGQFRVEYTDCVRITPEFHALLKKSQVFRGDCLIGRSGSIGNTAFVLKGDPQPLNSADIIIVRANSSKITNGYLAGFLNSRLGVLQIERLTSGGVQGHINLKAMEHLIIPLPSKVFQDTVNITVIRAMEIFRNAKESMEKAEQTLLRALSLENWQPPKPLTYTRRASDAFAAGRLDADYFEPKYDTMIAQMETVGECTTLESLLSVNRRGKQPKYAESGLQVINSKHVLKNGVRLNADNALAVTSDDALKIKTGDVLINGTGVGTIGRAAAYLHKQPALPDNHVTILRPRPGAIDPVYLAVYLNSIAGQWQVEKYLRGSSGQIELYPVDIAQFKICLAPSTVQQEVHDLVVSAFSAQRKAHALLEAAKRAVEIAIEDSEAAAMAYLKKMGDA